MYKSVFSLYRLLRIRRPFTVIFFLLVTSLILIFSGVGWSDIQAQKEIESLKTLVVQEMSGLPFVPQETCPLMPMNDNQAENAYDTGRSDALAHLLVAPQAQNRSATDLLDLFSLGVETATGTQDGAYLLDERDEFLLVSMKLPLCHRRHKYYFLPELYVFSRTGDYWSLSVGVIQHIEWMGNRWVGMMQLEIPEGRELYAFVHIVQEADGWRLRTFDDVPNSPSLMYLPDSTQVDYSNGYYKVSYSSDYTYGSLPCDFSNAFVTLGSLDSCHTCEISPTYAIYHGTFTFAWSDNNYVLTDDTPYQTTVILSDNTRLEETAPSETELEENSPFLRRGSWRDYCRAISPS